MSDSSIATADRYPRYRANVLDTEMAYVDTGTGDPVVFLHGNPTSSYLWRNIIPHVEPLGRCLAPDLVGMGESRPAPGGSYRFVDHARYLDAWFDNLGLTRRVTLVAHDWGSALAFHWAQRFPDRVRALVYMEAIVRPLAWEEWPETARSIFQTMRSQAGEEVVLRKNVFVERILPASVLRRLTDEEMSVYRRPYLEPGETRRPTLTWPREIPIGGEPADVVAIVERVRDVPDGEPGAEALRERRSGLDPRGCPARVLPALAKSTRGDREGRTLHPGGFAQRDWQGHRRVLARAAPVRRRVFRMGRTIVGLSMLMAVLAPPAHAQDGQVYGADQFFQLIWEPVEDGGRLSVGGYVTNNYGLEAINVRLLVESLDVHGRVVAKTIGYVNYPIPPRRAASSRSFLRTSLRASGCLCCHGTGGEAHPADACSPLGARRGRAPAAVFDRDGT